MNEKELLEKEKYCLEDLSIDLSLRDIINAYPDLKTMILDKLSNFINERQNRMDNDDVYCVNSDRWTYEGSGPMLKIPQAVLKEVLYDDMQYTNIHTDNVLINIYDFILYMMDSQLEYKTTIL